MVLKMALVGGAVLLALAGYVFARTPPIVIVTRSRLINASAESLFPYINNPHRIEEWDPFTTTDPAVKIAYSGPTHGVGAQWAWNGPKAGRGQAAVIESIPNERVTLRLDVKKPFNATNKGEYSLKSRGATTEITWTVYESALIPRMISVFISLDKLIGAEFDNGLLKLKTLTEIVV